MPLLMLVIVIRTYFLLELQSHFSYLVWGEGEGGWRVGECCKDVQTPQFGDDEISALMN